MKTVVERFWEKVDKSGGCWEWTASLVGSGYGQFYFNKKTQRAHRVSWELHYGEIPEGICVLHRCDNPPCVNPNHLFLGSHLDNTKDRDEKGRNGYTKRTHCPKGHSYSGDNLWINAAGRRVCRTCHTAYQRAYRAKNKDRVRGYQKAYRERKKNDF